ncbi:class F sortase [Peterkaempfera sp. SMS 1(5)a]|uniref:class F sortase n=1 Tax=Peterkaempfera podocarpi TaxID=3232308 RepID=UPI0036717142
MAAGLLLLGLGAGLIDRAAERPTVRIAAGTSAPGGGAAAPAHSSSPPHRGSRPFSLAASRPTRLSIPAAGVDAPVRDLGLNPDGTLEVPSADHADQVGWYRNGPTPGEVGPAVLVGHYDTVHGPAVFQRLPSLRPGDRISIRRADGTTAAFRVSRLLQYPKTGFPTDLVYGDTKGPELRLITCGGTLGAGGHWTDNIIVFAELVAPRS